MCCLCCALHGTSRHLFDACNRLASNLTLLFDTLYTPSESRRRLEEHVRQQSSGLLQGVSKHRTKSAICSVWFHKSNTTSMEQSLHPAKTPCLRAVGGESARDGMVKEERAEGSSITQMVQGVVTTLTFCCCEVTNLFLQTLSLWSW